eukprot:2810220-Pleurochrysis_carterae.AAC.3
MATRSRTWAATAREWAQARGLSAPTKRLREWGAQRAGAAIASRVPRAWGAERKRSGLRKYACECRLQMKGEHDDSL